MIHENQLVDILDINDVYCPAIVEKVYSDKTIYVKYIGWGEEWNEIIKVDSPRICVEVKTVRTKAWVKLNHRICMWPCMIFVRYSLPGSKLGEEYLRSEKRAYLVPYGPNCNPLKPYKHGVWITTKNITPFVTKKFDERCHDGFTSNYSDAFRLAIEECSADPVPTDYKFRFDGSFDVEAKRQETKRMMEIQQHTVNGNGSHSVDCTQQKNSSISNELIKRKRTKKNYGGPPENSIYRHVYSLFKTSSQNVHSSALHSIENVLNVLQLSAKMIPEPNVLQSLISSDHDEIIDSDFKTHDSVASSTTTKESNNGTFDDTPVKRMKNGQLVTSLSQYLADIESTLVGCVDNFVNTSSANSSDCAAIVESDLRHASNHREEPSEHRILAVPRTAAKLTNNSLTRASVCCQDFDSNAQHVDLQVPAVIFPFKINLFGAQFMRQLKREKDFQANNSQLSTTAVKCTKHASFNSTTTTNQKSPQKRCKVKITKCRANPRKQRIPNQIEIKRTATYLSLDRIKKSLAAQPKSGRRNDR